MCFKLNYPLSPHTRNRVQGRGKCLASRRRWPLNRIGLRRKCKKMQRPGSIIGPETRLFCADDVRTRVPETRTERYAERFAVPKSTFADFYGNFGKQLGPGSRDDNDISILRPIVYRFATVRFRQGRPFQTEDAFIKHDTLKRYIHGGILIRGMLIFARFCVSNDVCTEGQLKNIRLPFARYTWRAFVNDYRFIVIKF